MFAFDNVKTVKREDGSTIIMNKIGEIVVKTEQGVEKERYPAIYGATIFFKDGDKLTLGIKFLSGTRLRCQFFLKLKVRLLLKTLIVGSTVKEEMDAVTGLSHKVVIEAKNKEDASKQPRIVIVDENGIQFLFQELKDLLVYRLPVGSNITVK